MVLGDVPKAERCRCGEGPRSANGFKVTPKQAPAAAQPQGKLRAWLGR